MILNRAVLTIIIIDDKSNRHHIIDNVNELQVPIISVEYIIITDDPEADYTRVKQKVNNLQRTKLVKYTDIVPPEMTTQSRMNRGLGLSSSNFVMFITKDSPFRELRIKEDCEYLIKKCRELVMDYRNLGTVTMTGTSDVNFETLNIYGRNFTIRRLPTLKFIFSVYKYVTSRKFCTCFK